MRFSNGTGFADFAESDGKITNKTVEGDEVSEETQYHTMYITLVLSDILLYADPTTDLEALKPKLEEAAKTCIRINNYLTKVIYCLC